MFDAWRRVLVGAAVAVMTASAPAQDPVFTGLAGEVAQAERAFARSMAQRDHAEFTRWLSEHAVFFGASEVLRGKEAVAAGWKPYFDGPAAPFSWGPDRIEVLADGTLAYSSGPVRNAEGKLIARFHSIWRRDAPGRWRIVFDRGEAARE